MSSQKDQVDALVIGSGVGGLACAAALARFGKSVLVLEQQHTAGGLTQSFSRYGFRWDVGLHYLGEMGRGGEARPVIDWLSGGAIAFQPLGEAYDIVHFPDHVAVRFARPKDALIFELKAHFPDSAAEIDAFFAAVAEAVHAAKAVFMQRALSGFLGEVHGLWHKREVEKWWGRSIAEVVDAIVSDRRLRALLLAQRGDYGGMKAGETSFGMHAVVMNHYLNGAWYPVGGAGAFAQALIPVIEQAGGAIRLGARVRALQIADGSATGVQLDDGTVLHAPAVISDIGARNTVGMLPEALLQTTWAQEVLSLRPSVCHVTLYLGLKGDIRAHGASAFNHWFYDSWDVDSGVWEKLAPEADSNEGAERSMEGAPAPVLFVSFPSLKDPAYAPGDNQRHSAEVVAMVDWDEFSQWRTSKLRDRPAAYTDFKASLERSMLAQFIHHFPELGPMVCYHEVSTPLTMQAYTGAQQGASYGLEVSPRRFLSNALNVRTPIPRLYLAGQDVTSPGVVGAMMGGVLAAAAIEHRIYAHLG
jgi:all-trans-retinol 13,14-reductase